MVPTPTNGTVRRLAGSTGLIVVKAAPATPLPVATSNQTPVTFSGPSALETNPAVPVLGDTRMFPDQRVTATEQPIFRASINAGLFIVDEVTAGTPELTARGIQPGERYFVIGGIAATPPTQGLPGMTPGSVTRYAVSDGLDAARAGQPGGFATGQTIEAQFVRPGAINQPTAFNQYNAFRPEETFVVGGARGDTHLLAIADPATQQGEPPRNPAMRADLQVTAGGQANASVSVGGIVTLPANQQGRTAAALALSGRTVGSAQNDTARGPVRITSNLGSLGTDASGAGAHLVGASDNAPGQAGYFAVSQADTWRGAPGTPEGAQPGTLQPVGSDAGIPFAYTRLATNVGNRSGLQPGALDHQGYATGVVQAFTGQQSTPYALSSGAPGDVTIQTSPRSAAEFNAALRMAPAAVGELSSDPLAAPAPTGSGGARIVLFGGGGTAPNTAVASPTTFAAVGDGIALASVNDDLLAGVAGATGRSIAHPATGVAVDASLPASSPHLAWDTFWGTQWRTRARLGSTASTSATGWRAARCRSIRYAR